jgi:hypothetical protein
MREIPFREGEGERERVGGEKREERREKREERRKT